MTLEEENKFLKALYKGLYHYGRSLKFSDDFLKDNPIDSYDKLKLALDTQLYVRETALSAFQKNKDYTAVDIPIKDILNNYWCESDSRKQFFMRHAICSQEEYFDNQEKLARYYNILKKNNRDLNDESCKLINSIGIQKVGMNKNNDERLKKAGYHSLYAYKNYTAQEIIDNMRAFDFEKIFIIKNSGAIPNELNLEAVDYFKKNGIFKEFMQGTFTDLISDNSIYILNTEIKYSDINVDAEASFKSSHGWYAGNFKDYYEVSSYNIYYLANTFFHPDFSVKAFSEFFGNKKAVAAYETMKNEHMEKEFFEFVLNRGSGSAIRFQLAHLPDVVNRLLQKRNGSN